MSEASAGNTSVVIPCYNVQKYLGQALDSVRGQTIPVREIVVVDDGSRVPVKLPARWDGPPLKLFRTENRGLPAARNLGIDHCSGEYVAFLDADDAWRPRKLEMQECALRSRPDAVASFTRCVDEPGYRPLGPYPDATADTAELVRLLWKDIFFPPSTFMARRDALLGVGRFDEALRNTGEDVELFLRLLAVGTFVQVPEPLCYYRDHGEQMTRDLCRMIKGHKQARGLVIERHPELLEAAGIARHRFWDAQRDEVLQVYARRAYDHARPLLWDHWKENPADLHLLGCLLVTCLPSPLRGLLKPAASSKCQQSAA
ncbi:MAG: glycosyltransferase family 2 protein [Gemmataceae bacterium]